MKPLLFLTVRSTWNGIRRALTSARRLIGLLFAVFYYFFLVNRPFDRHQPTVFPTHAKLAMPALDFVEAAVFGFLAVMSIILALGMFGTKGGFRPADVDVLFPTPVSPRLVLVFRIVRDYLLTLLVPLLIVLFTWRQSSAGLQFLFNNLPESSSAQYIGKAFSTAWIMMALAWVALTYAIGMFVNRSDLDSDRNKKIIGLGLFLLVIAIGGFLYVRIHSYTGPESILAILRAPFMRVVFFTATFGTEIVMAPLTGHWLHLLFGMGGLASIIVGAFYLAFTQVGWMYDQAAVKGFDSLTSRSLQQKGDMIGLFAEQARRGKLKAGKQRWFHKLKLKGPAAIVWKEIIIEGRSMMLMLLLMGVMSLAIVSLPIFLPTRRTESGVVFLLMQGVAAFMMSMLPAQSGFIELLRRGDLQKPLPFSAASVVFAEVLGKAFPAMFVCICGSLISLIFNPQMWAFCLAAVLEAPVVAVLICSTIFLVTVLFPDVDDPTQRGFRGLMTMLGLVILGAPVVGVFIGIFFLLRSTTLAPIYAAVPSAGLALALSLGVALVGGGLYANYNPSE